MKIIVPSFDELISAYFASELFQNTLTVALNEARELTSQTGIKHYVYADKELNLAVNASLPEGYYKIFRVLEP